MQIRIGNKQDEPGCRNLVESNARAMGLRFDLQNDHSDLRNVEQSYIGRDGIFLVAEEDQNVIAFAAAARGDSEDVCVLRRLTVETASRRVGLGKKMLEHVIFFARNLDYRVLLVGGEESDISKAGQDFLSAAGFLSREDGARGKQFEFIL